MVTIDAYSDFSECLASLHPRLFPIEYEFVEWDELRSCVVELTRLLNKALEFYHSLEKVDEKMTFSPKLTYGQAVLSLMTRCLIFEPKQLTKYNQVLKDLDTMLADMDKLVATKYTEIAEYQLKIVNDEAFKEIAGRFMDSFFTKE